MSKLRRLRLAGLLLLGVFVFVWSDVRSQTANREEAKKSAEPEEKSDDKAWRAVEERGVVVRYQPALKRLFGLKLDSNQAEEMLALETKDGRLVPILPTEAARFFYDDAERLNQEVQIEGRVFDRTPGLQIIKIYRIKDGRKCDAYYWCNICSIKMYHLKDCDCCQGPIEYREVPVGESFRFNNEKND